MNTLASLLIKEKDIWANIIDNRKQAGVYLSNNRKLRKQLEEVRNQIVSFVVEKTNRDKKTLYQVVKENLGVIDERYNKIYDLVILSHQ